MSDSLIVFGSGRGLFGVLTLPEGERRRRRGVVICSPLGHANVCSYRPLRTLARRLGNEGWPVLRFDWPGTGDSGDPDPAADPRHLWEGAIAEAVTEVCARAGVDGVSLVGLGIGGTLALALAGSHRAVTSIALLDPHASGRTYLRESRALQALSDGASASRSYLAEGDLELSGFFVSSREAEALSTLDLATCDISMLAGRRLLVVTSQQSRAASALAERLASAGFHVRVETLPALRHATEGTETSVMPRPVSSLVGDWLAANPEPVTDESLQRNVRVRKARSISVATIADDGCQDRPVVLDTPYGRLAGMLCEPAGPARDDWVVFFNAGRVRRMGPNRMMTAFGRAWARNGLPSLRFDFVGVGDSDGDLADDERPTAYESSWYTQATFSEQARYVLEWLVAERAARRFALIGLCSGAFWSFQVAHTENRVAGVSLLNPRMLHIDGRAADLDAWAELCRIARHPRRLQTMRGRGLRSLPLAATRGAALAMAGKGNPSWQRRLILESLDELRAQGTGVGVVFSDGDLGIRYLRRHLGPSYQRELGRCGATVEVIDGTDHTFRPLWSHPVLRQAIERQLGKIGFLESAELDSDAS